MPHFQTRKKKVENFSVLLFILENRTGFYKSLKEVHVEYKIITLNISGIVLSSKI